MSKSLKSSDASLTDPRARTMRSRVRRVNGRVCACVYASGSVYAAAAVAALCVCALIIMTDRLVHEVGQVHGHASCIEAVVDTHARTFCACTRTNVRVSLISDSFFSFPFLSSPFFAFCVLCSSRSLPFSFAHLSRLLCMSEFATNRITNTIALNSADRLRASLFNV